MPMIDCIQPTHLLSSVHQSPELLLSYISHTTDTLIKCSEHKKYYQHRLLPDIGSFVNYIYSKCHLTPTVLVIGLIYLERLKACLPNESQGEYDTPYKMFLASVVLASKFVDDGNTVTHAVYRAVAVLYTREELNEMERSFLGVINFNLYVSLNQVTCFLEEHQYTIGLELNLV
ncbi:hypothetical protein BDF14DRAFT_1753581 [Spinellus fusiger]|nr:hypothetical protein BDF14DRAFT_1753581 [Spinellus fusiger]